MLHSSEGSPWQTCWEGLGIAVIALDCTGKIMAWNRKAEAVSGLTSVAVMSKQFVSLMEPSVLECWEDSFKAGLLGQSTAEIRLICDGNVVTFSARLTSQSSSNGDLEGIVCFLDTISNLPSSSMTYIEANLEALSTNGHACGPANNLSAKAGSANELRVFLDRVLLPIFTVDSSCRVFSWNRSLSNLTGFSAEEITGHSVLDSCCDSSVCREQFRKLIAQSYQGVDSNATMHFKTKNGRVCPIRMLTYAMQEEGAPQKIAVLVQDISREADLEQTLAKSDNLIRDVSVSIIGIDTQGCCQLWNREAETLSGFMRDEINGKHFLSHFVPSSAQAAVRDALKVSLRGIATSSFELKFQARDGDIRYLLADVAPWRGDNDQIFGSLIISRDLTDAAQHNRAVANTAKELRQFIDTANTPIFGIDLQGKINEWNDKSAEITSISADDAFGQPFVETFISEDLRDSVRSVLVSALAGRGTANFELELGDRNRDIRYILVNATTRRDIDDNIVGVTCIAQDVTETSKHDRAVASMASELRQLIDTANAPIFGIDRNGDINEWNDKIAEISGYTKEEAFDCSLIETFIDPSMQGAVRDIFESALEGRGTSNYGLEFKTKSSERRVLLVNATTRRDASNNVVGVVAVAQDVTEAVQRDKAAAGMAIELRQLIDTANAPIFGIDIDGNINEWNNRTQEITGYSKEDTFDESLVDRFIAPSMRQKVQEIMNAALHGQETSNYELEFIAKSGESRFMLVNATTRRDSDGKVVGVVGVGQDVTEDRKHAVELRKMQYLQATQEAKVETERNMTAYFAHELRNPLGAIDSALNAMPDDLPDNARSLVAGMQLCSSFMSSIMNNLLDVRKMEEGKMTLHAVPVSLESSLTRVHRMLHPSVKSGVSFSAECSTSPNDWVFGDEHRIQQVMTNVITNAIKYTVSGSIVIRMSWEGEMVRFECIDTGPGIPKREQEKLFERFVQRGGAPGTGLGLAIAKHLVDLAGGSIRFDSDPTVKPGTSCIVLMPLHPCDRHDSSPKEVEDGTISMFDEALKILIIDDVGMNRTMLARRIKKAIAPNCTIVEAATGEEALEICGSEVFDVIVVDQYMEEAGGVLVGTDVVHAMRRMRIKAIIIGCSGNDLDDEFREAGADWVWKKPMPSNQLIIANLREVLTSRQLL